MMLSSKCHDGDDDDDGGLMIVDKLYEEVSCSPTMNHSWLSLRFYILPKQPNKPLNDHNQSLTQLGCSLVVTQSMCQEALERPGPASW